MDKASDFGSEDCRFESCHGRLTFLATWNDYPINQRPEAIMGHLENNIDSIICISQNMKFMSIF